MINIDKDKIQEKLRKIKALAERGIGGEKETALRLYQELLAKYEMSDEEIEEDKIAKVWFRFNDELDKKLLTQIFCKVTGSPSHYVKLDKRRNLVGVECTKLEQSMIVFYYQFYSEQLKKELDKFMVAFFNANNIFPDETARCYEQYKDLKGTERSHSEWLQIDFMASGMDRETPNLQIEQRKE